MNCKKILVGILSAAMVFTTMAIPAFADESETKVAEINKIGYNTLTAAITAASANDTVTLLSNVTESITVENGKNITLDLNGKTLTNVEGNDTIKNYGTLTIEDNSTDKNGKVDNVSHAKAALINYEDSSVTLKSGTFARSSELGTDSGANGNSWYTIANFGAMEINNNVTVENSGTFSSLITNGYYDATKVTDPKTATLTINGGKFTGGKWTVKNDDKGKLVINNGEFTHLANFGGVVLNNNIATINGGTFVDDGSRKWALGTVYAQGGNNAGITTITDGKFTGKLTQETIGAKISISGGTFNTNVNSYCAEGFAPTKNADGTFTVKEKGITWDYGTDSGIYTAVDGNNYGVMRFMFSTDINANDVTKIGIKYISSKLENPTNGETAAGTNVEGETKKNAVQGDIIKIPTNNTNTYYAAAFIEVGGKTYWSAPISCTLDKERTLAGYTEGGNN